MQPDENAEQILKYFCILKSSFFLKAFEVDSSEIINRRANRAFL